MVFPYCCSFLTYCPVMDVPHSVPPRTPRAQRAGGGLVAVAAIGWRGRPTLTSARWPGWSRWVMACTTLSTAWPSAPPSPPPSSKASAPPWPSCVRSSPTSWVSRDGIWANRSTVLQVSPEVNVLIHSNAFLFRLRNSLLRTCLLTYRNLRLNILYRYNSLIRFLLFTSLSFCLQETLWSCWTLAWAYSRLCSLTSCQLVAVTWAWALASWPATASPQTGSLPWQGECSSTSLWQTWSVSGKGDEVRCVCCKGGYVLVRVLIRHQTHLRRSPLYFHTLGEVVCHFYQLLLSCLSHLKKKNFLANVEKYHDVWFDYIKKKNLSPNNKIDSEVQGLSPAVNNFLFIPSVQR